MLTLAANLQLYYGLKWSGLKRLKNHSSNVRTYYLQDIYDHGMFEITVFFEIVFQTLTSLVLVAAIITLELHLA